MPAVVFSNGNDIVKRKYNPHSWDANQFLKVTELFCRREKERIQYPSTERNQVKTGKPDGSQCLR